MGGFANNAPIVTDGLVFYVDAGNSNSYPGSGTTWSDLAGSDDATLQNGASYDSAYGGVMELDGTDDYIQADVAATTDSSFTYNFWFNTKDIDGQNSRNWLISNRNNGGFGAFVTHTSSAWEYTVGKVALYPVSDSISTNTIYNACFVIDGTTFTMYVDGALVGSTTITATRTDSGQEEAMIGVVTETDGTVRAGSQSDLSVYSLGYYDRALSASEVLQNYNALKNRFV